MKFKNKKGAFSLEYVILILLVSLALVIPFILFQSGLTEEMRDTIKSNGMNEKGDAEYQEETRDLDSPAKFNLIVYDAAEGQDEFKINNDYSKSGILSSAGKTYSPAFAAFDEVSNKTAEEKAANPGRRAGYLQYQAKDKDSDEIIKEFTVSGGKIKTLYLYYKAIEYQITYNPGGKNYTLTYEGEDTNPKTYNVNTGGFSVKNPIREGYDFAGWTGSNISSATKNLTVPAGTTGDLVFTATWDPKTYTISYNLDGGTNDSSNPTTYTPDSPTITLKNPTRENYEFVGWTGDGNLTPIKNLTIPTGSIGNKTYTANWKSLVKYGYKTATSYGTSQETLPDSDYYRKITEYQVKCGKTTQTSTSRGISGSADSSTSNTYTINGYVTYYWTDADTCTSSWTNYSLPGTKLYCDGTAIATTAARTGSDQYTAGTSVANKYCSKIYAKATNNTGKLFWNGTYVNYYTYTTTYGTSGWQESSTTCPSGYTESPTVASTRAAYQLVVGWSGVTEVSTQEEAVAKKSLTIMPVMSIDGGKTWTEIK